MSSTLLHVMSPMFLIGVIAFTSTAKNYALSHQSSLAVQNVLASSSPLNGMHMARGGATRLFQSSNVKPADQETTSLKASTETLFLSDPSLVRA